MAKAGNGESGNPQAKTKRGVQSRASRWKTEPWDVENAWRLDAFGRSLFQVLPVWDSPRQCTRLPGFRSSMMLDVRSLLFLVVGAREGQAVKYGDIITFAQLVELLEEKPEVLVDSLSKLLSANCDQIQDNEGNFLFEVGWKEMS